MPFSYASLFYFYQFNPEIQFFSSHFVIGIQGDGLFFFCCYLNRKGPSILIGKIYLLPYFQIFCSWKFFYLYGKDSIGIRQSICLLRHKVNIYNLAYFHIRYRRVKSPDHHTRTAYEF